MFWTQSVPTCWLVITRPCGETNDPDPPLSKRTEAFCRCSSQPGVTSKWYLLFSSAAGGLLNNHMPSSALTVAQNASRAHATPSRLAWDLVIRYSTGQQRLQ